MSVIRVARKRAGTDDKALLLRDRETNLYAKLIGLASLAF
jgi:hypothetical protein